LTLLVAAVMWFSMPCAVGPLRMALTKPSLWLSVVVGAGVVVAGVV